MPHLPRLVAMVAKFFMNERNVRNFIYFLLILFKYLFYCGGLKAFTSATTFEKCGVRTSSGGQGRYILYTY